MIPGSRKPLRRKAFRKGLRCGVVGCTRRARHQWAYPCAITTMAVKPAAPRWVPVCDDCDIELNRALLAVVGVPKHVIVETIDAYRLIQGDGAYDVA